jgi:Tfp pilus assembly protein PilN
MIELNLVEKKEPIKLPVVLGVDLNEMNLVLLFFAIIIWYVPQFFLEDYVESQTKEYNTSLEDMKTKMSKLQKEIGKNGQIKEMLKAYQDQVERLKTRSAQVDEVLKMRTNPKKVLEKIARSIPEDIWFNELKINNQNEIFINGGTYNNRSLGEFITIVNDSPYFAGSLTPVKQENRTENLDGIPSAFDYFELRGKIRSYDMRAR